MNLLFLIVAVVHTAYSYNYSEYLREYRKNYAGTEDLVAREELFERRVREIEETNGRDVGYLLSVNNYTDWTDEELGNRNRVNINVDVNTSVVKRPLSKNLKQS